ncbi:unnamed protein product, partial [Ectocarpus sp. 8 AP-2014]
SIAPFPFYHTIPLHIAFCNKRLSKQNTTEHVQKLPPPAGGWYALCPNQATHSFGTNAPRLLVTKPSYSVARGFSLPARNYLFLWRFESALVTTGTYYRTIPTRDLKTTSTRFNDSLGSLSLVKPFRKEPLGHLTQRVYSLCVESRYLTCLRKKGSSCNRGSIFQLLPALPSPQMPAAHYTPQAVAGFPADCWSEH